MTIAVPYADGIIFQHFGHTQSFKLYRVEQGVITDSQVVDTNGSGHGALAGMLAELGADILICGGIGGGARQALTQAGIALYGGCSGEADTAVEDLLTGTLRYHPDAGCSHHGEGHSCGHHSCGGSCHG